MKDGVQEAFAFRFRFFVRLLVLVDWISFCKYGIGCKKWCLGIVMAVWFKIGLAAWAEGCGLGFGLSFFDPWIKWLLSILEILFDAKFLSKQGFKPWCGCILISGCWPLSTLSFLSFAQFPKKYNSSWSLRNGNFHDYNKKDQVKIFRR